MMEIDILDRVDDGDPRDCSLDFPKVAAMARAPCFTIEYAIRPILYGVCRASTFTRLESCIGVSG